VLCFKFDINHQDSVIIIPQYYDANKDYDSLNLAIENQECSNSHHLEHQELNG
jgi:hypothetical protein